MNIDDYKKVMQSYSVDTNRIKSRFAETKEKKSYQASRNRKCFFICVILTALIFLLFNLNIANDKNISNYTLSVYASSREMEKTLSDIPIILTNEFKMMGITNEGNEYEEGTINFDLNFRCKGENIKKITYKLSDKLISCENRYIYEAWFAENAPYDTAADSDKSVYVKAGRVGEKYAFVTKMIGSSYTVNYENQNDKNYELEIQLKPDKKGNMTAKEFIITVIITLNDDTEIEKHILVHPLNYSTSGNTHPKIEMRLID